MSDFVNNRLSDKMLTAQNEFIRQASAVVVRSKMGSGEVFEAI
ncbi:MAG: hypothetical protein AAGH17_02850 [Pseudomonadota bacterium]